jgi:hypothetical protein
VVLIISAILDPSSAVEIDHALDVVNSILDFMSCCGNESATSCKDILQALSYARQLITAPRQVMPPYPDQQPLHGGDPPHAVDGNHTQVPFVSHLDGQVPLAAWTPQLMIPSMMEDNGNEWDAFLHSIGMTL